MFVASGPKKPVLSKISYAGHVSVGQIVQTPDKVVIFAEMVHDARIVRLDGQHLPPQIRAWKGIRLGTGTATRWLSKRPISRIRPDFKDRLSI